MITVAVLTKSSRIFNWDRDKIFHGKLASKRNVSVREGEFPLKSA
jgi:hypothetical protein